LVLKPARRNKWLKNSANYLCAVAHAKSQQLAIWEAELRRMAIQGQSRQKLSKTLSQSTRWILGLTPVVGGIEVGGSQSRPAMGKNTTLYLKKITKPKKDLEDISSGRAPA
jgi:hypothetical protein